MPFHKKFAYRSRPGPERATASLDVCDLFSVDRVGTEPEGIAITAKKVFFKNILRDFTRALPLCGSTNF
jgi:hypothetical protein